MQCTTVSQFEENPTTHLFYNTASVQSLYNNGCIRFINVTKTKSFSIHIYTTSMSKSEFRKYQRGTFWRNKMNIQTKQNERTKQTKQNEEMYKWTNETNKRSKQRNKRTNETNKRTNEKRERTKKRWNPISHFDLWHFHPKMLQFIS